MTHNRPFHYHADMTTKGLASAKVEVLLLFFQQVIDEYKSIF